MPTIPEKAITSEKYAKFKIGFFRVFALEEGESEIEGIQRFIKGRLMKTYRLGMKAIREDNAVVDETVLD